VVAQATTRACSDVVRAEHAPYIAAGASQGRTALFAFHLCAICVICGRSVVVSVPIDITFTGFARAVTLQAPAGRRVVATGGAARPHGGPTRNPWKAEIRDPPFFILFAPAGRRGFSGKGPGPLCVRPSLSGWTNKGRKGDRQPYNLGRCPRLLRLSPSG